MGVGSRRRREGAAGPEGRSEGAGCGSRLRLRPWGRGSPEQVREAGTARTAGTVREQEGNNSHRCSRKDYHS